MNFSFFKNGIFSIIPSKSISILELLDMIKKDNPLVEEIRRESDKKKRNKLKERLSYVTISGTFKRRSKNNLIKSSRLACFDIDDILSSDLVNVKKQLSQNEYTHALFLSPSGNGLKLIIKIPEVKNDLEYKKYWCSIAQHLNFKENDENVKDISRACYLSVDKEPYYNQDSKVYSETCDVIEKVKGDLKTSKENITKKNITSFKSDFLDKLKSVVSMPTILSNFCVDISKNPTDCPFHYCSNPCLSFNEELCHCFDSDCNLDNSWNIISFVKKIKNCNSKEAVEWLADFANMKKEYNENKEDYFLNQREPSGWARSINIQTMAKRYDLERCPKCNNLFTFFNTGFYKCKTCRTFGGLKKFAKLCLIKREGLL